jgi:hypothetical protein
MNIQYPRHMHTPSWEQSNNNSGKRKETQTVSNSFPNNSNNNQQHADSFFNRVFGHHSSESSRGKKISLLT